MNTNYIIHYELKGLPYSKEVYPVSAVAYHADKLIFLGASILSIDSPPGGYRFTVFKNDLIRLPYDHQTKSR